MAPKKATLNCQNPECSQRAQETKFMKCGACKKVSYCSKECQVAHWRVHKPICKTLRDNQNLPDMDDVMTRLEELRPAIYGRHAPATQRIVLCPLDGRDADCMAARTFANNLDFADVTRYAVEKFLETGDKGGVVFNIKYPYMDSPTYSRLFWIPRASWVSSLHPVLARDVTEYDPAGVALLFFALPSEDGLSMKLWSRQLMFHMDPLIGPEVARAKETWSRNISRWARGSLFEPQE